MDIGAYEAWMEQISGDFDGDGRVNLAALGGFQLCTGAGVAKPGLLDTCLCLFDGDESEDIDLCDFGDFQPVLGGSDPWPVQRHP